MRAVILRLRCADGRLREENVSIELPLSADIYIAVLLFCFGACMGSFLTCAADRYVRKESVLRGRSRCDSCGSRLGFFELIPILSYVCLRGRCRKCGARIPPRCLFAELFAALMYFGVYVRFGFGFVTLEYLLLFSALFALALIDLDTMEIPDGLILFGLAVYVAFLYPHGDYLARAKDGLLGAAVYGGGILLISFLMDFALGKETLGGGDVKLFALLGLYTGLKRGLLMLLISCVAGLIFAAVRGDKKKEFPFGPAIAFAAIVTLVVGQEILDLYLSLIL